jgi:hypothetical protein
LGLMISKKMGSGVSAIYSGFLKPVKKKEKAVFEVQSFDKHRLLSVLNTAYVVFSETF